MQNTLFFILSLCSCTAFLSSTTAAFNLAPPSFIPAQRNAPLFLSSAAVTSSSSSSPSSSTTKEELKNQIRKLAQGTDNGIKASESIQSEIKSIVQKLEQEQKNNPVTTNLTSDSKLNGSWGLVYTTNGGSSAGKLGPLPFVGSVEQLISVEDDYYVNYVRLGGSIVEGALTATWDVLSDDKWQVNFETIVFKVLGITLLEKELTAKGIWRKTYLDDDFRILYAAGVSAPKDNDDDEQEGKGVVKENIYILSK